MLEGSNVFVVDLVEDEVAEGLDGCLIFHEFILLEGKLTRGFDLSLVRTCVARLESWIGRYDEWDIVDDFRILFGGDVKGEVAKVGLVRRNG